MQEKTFTTASQIIKNYEEYKANIAVYETFDQRIGTDFIDLGNPVGFDLNAYLLDNGIKPIDYNYLDINELIKAGVDALTDSSPFYILKQENKEILIAALEYFSLNLILDKLGICTEQDEPISLQELREDDESWHTPTKMNLLYNNFNSEGKKMSILMTLDNGSDIEQEALEIWSLCAYLIDDNNIVGTIEADLATSEYKLTSQDYLLAMDEDSAFLMEQAHAILSNYLKNPDTPHDNIHDLFSGLSGLGCFSTLHIYGLNINEEYRGKKLSYAMFENIADMVTNANVLNIQEAIDGGFTHNHSLLDIDEFTDHEGWIENDYDIEAKTNGISLIGMNVSVDNFIKRESQDEEASQENINIAIEKAQSVQKYFNSFRYDMEPLGIEQEAPLTVFCSPLNHLDHETEIALLGTYLTDPDKAENIGPFNPEYQTKVS